MAETTPVYEGFLTRFRRNANSLAMRYGAPVWLTGGALEEEHPRDFDVRIILDDAGMKFIFGRYYIKERTANDYLDYVTWEWRRSYSNLKVSREMSRRMVCPVDFQIQTEAEASFYKDKPRVRCDSTPEWIWKKFGIRAM